MTMKTLKLASIPALLATLALSPMSQATAAPKITHKAARALLRPDLRCSIRAFEDPAGMKPIANGATLNYGGGAPKFYMRLIVENGGRQGASGFNANVRVQRDSANMFAENETLALPAGLAKIYPLVTVPALGASTKVRGSISLDGRSAVLETNEHNNLCSFEFDVHIVQ